MASDSLADGVRAFTFGLPGAWEDHPWGDTVAKVGKRVFVFLGGDPADDGSCWLGVKLPESKDEALSLPFAKLMGYGLDRGGWVGIQAPADMPLDVLTSWIEESYRAVATKSLIAELDQRARRSPAEIAPGPPSGRPQQRGKDVAEEVAGDAGKGAEHQDLDS
jgi:predicted DNA-binding protein (MmcQ/YjbR family)